MKKLMIALACSATFAALADTDDDNGAFNFAGFEGYTADTAVAGLDDNGTQQGDILWEKDGTADESKVQAYGDATRKFDYNATCDVPKLFKGETSEKYLELNTSGDKLSRILKKDGGNAVAVPVDSAVYIDTMVQFTATTTDPSDSDFDNAKLGIWLKDNEDETYTLRVFAGDNNGTTASSKAYSLTDSNSALTVQPNVWYRLTVAAIKDICQDETQTLVVPAFRVYLDGQLLKVDGSLPLAAISAQLIDNNLVKEEYKADLQNGTALPCLVQGEALTLTAVDFSGSGAIDDFVATTTDPFGEVAPSDIQFTLSWDTTGLTAVSYTIGDNTTNIEDLSAGQAQFDVKAGATVTVAATANEANWYTVTGGTGDITVADDANSATITVAKQAYTAEAIADDATGASIGLTGTFADKTGATVRKVVEWAETIAGVTKDAVNGITFEADGTASSALAKAYLLDVAEAGVADAEETAAEALKIKSIAQDEEGNWVVEPGCATYGNGTVKVFSSTALDGTYSDGGDEAAEGQAFYKAVLVFE